MSFTAKQQTFFIINFVLTFFRRKKWFLISAAAIILIISSLSYYFLVVSGHDQISEGIVGTHEERDLPDVVLNLISEPLIRVDKTGSPSAELAESWEVNSEANLYKVKLKPDLKWIDGQPVKASEIYISIPDVQINPIDDQTLEFKLAESFSP